MLIVTGLELQLSHYLMFYSMLYKSNYIFISLISSLLVVLFDFMSAEEDVHYAKLHKVFFEGFGCVR
jgi:hypothetical protein